MNQASCPCKRTNCPRHGDCDACRAHHQASRRRRPCEKEPEKAARAARPRRLRETVKEAMEIKLGTLQELDGWMELVSRVKDSFPGLETREALEAHRETVQEFMQRGSAICAMENGRVVGALLFSAEENTLCFLAVDPSFRRRHAAARMVSFMLPMMDPEREITVTTYREGDPAGAAARAFYKKLGFAEGKLTEEFGSPVQEFVLQSERR